MNMNQARGIAKDIEGKVQGTAGDLVGSPSLELRGIQKQVSGKTEEKLGDAMEAVKHPHDAHEAIKSL